MYLVVIVFRIELFHKWNQTLVIQNTNTYRWLKLSYSIYYPWYKARTLCENTMEMKKIHQQIRENIEKWDWECYWFKMWRFWNGFTDGIIFFAFSFFLNISDYVCVLLVDCSFPVFSFWFILTVGKIFDK